MHIGRGARCTAVAGGERRLDKKEEEGHLLMGGELFAVTL